MIKNRQLRIIIIISALFIYTKAFAGTPEEIWIGEKGKNKVIVLSFNPNSIDPNVECTEEDESSCQVLGQFIKKLKKNSNNRFIVNSTFIPEDVLMDMGADPNKRKFLYFLCKIAQKEIDTNKKGLFFVYNSIERSIGLLDPINQTWVLIPSLEDIENFTKKVDSRVRDYLRKKREKIVELTDKFGKDNFLFDFCRKYSEPLVEKMSLGLFTFLLNAEPEHSKFPECIHLGKYYYSNRYFEIINQLIGLFTSKKSAIEFLDALMDSKKDSKMNSEEIKERFAVILKEITELKFLKIAINECETTLLPNKKQTTVIYSNPKNAQNIIVLLKLYCGYKETFKINQDQKSKKPISAKLLKDILINENYTFGKKSELSSTISPVGSDSSSSTSSASSSTGGSSKSWQELSLQCTYCKEFLHSKISCQICGAKYCNATCQNADEPKHFETCLSACCVKLCDVLNSCKKIMDSVDEKNNYDAFNVFNKFTQNSLQYLALVTDFFKKKSVAPGYKKMLTTVQQTMYKKLRDYTQTYINKQQEKLNKLITEYKYAFENLKNALLKKELDNVKKYKKACMEILQRLRHLLRTENNLFESGFRNDNVRFVVNQRKIIKKFCDNCAKYFEDRGLYLCSACHAYRKYFSYCSKECQRSNWQNHKKICKKNDELIKRTRKILTIIMSLEDKDERYKNLTECLTLLSWISFKSIQICSEHAIKIAKQYDLEKSFELQPNYEKIFEDLTSRIKQNTAVDGYLKYLYSLNLDYEKRDILYVAYRYIYYVLGEDFFATMKRQNVTILKPNQLINCAEEYIRSVLTKLLIKNKLFAERELNEIDNEKKEAIESSSSSSSSEDEADEGKEENKKNYSDYKRDGSTISKESFSQPLEQLNPMTFFLHQYEGKSLLEQIAIVLHKMGIQDFEIIKFVKSLNPEAKSQILNWIELNLKRLDLIQATKLASENGLKETKKFNEILKEIERFLDIIEKNIHAHDKIQQIKFTRDYSQILFVLIYKYIYETISDKKTMDIVPPVSLINNFDHFVNAARKLMMQQTETGWFPKDAQAKTPIDKSISTTSKESKSPINELPESSEIKPSESAAKIDDAQDDEITNETIGPMIPLQSSKIPSYRYIAKSTGGDELD